MSSTVCFMKVVVKSALQRRSVSEIVPCFLHFSSDVDKIRYGKYNSWMYNARKWAQWKPDLKLIGVQSLLPFLGTVIVRIRKKCDKTGPLTMLLGICEFCENRRRKYLTFGMSVYDIKLRVYRTVEPHNTLNMKNALTVCLLRHTGYTIASYHIWNCLSPIAFDLGMLWSVKCLLH